MRCPGSALRIARGIGQRRSWLAQDHALDRAAFEMRRDAAAGGFDFGKFRHGSLRSGFDRAVACIASVISGLSWRGTSAMRPPIAT